MILVSVDFRRFLKHAWSLSPPKRNGRPVMSVKLSRDLPMIGGFWRKRTCASMCGNGRHWIDGGLRPTSTGQLNLQAIEAEAKPCEILAQTIGVVGRTAPLARSGEQGASCFRQASTATAYKHYLQKLSAIKRIELG